MTLQEWKAQMGRGGTTGPPPPVAAGAAPVDPNAPRPTYETDATDPKGEHLSLTGDPARYLGHAAKGLARSPIDLVKGLLGLPATVIKGLVKDLPTLLSDPSLIAEAPAAVGDAAKFANTHPDEMGSLLGQSLIAPRVPGAANTALAKGPTVVGRTMSAVGRGAEAVGTSKVAKLASKYGPLEAVFRGDPYGVAAAALPPVLEHGGKLMQRGGAALEGLDLSLKGKRPFSGVPEAAAVDDGADTVRETVRTARELKDKGMSPGQAAQRSGWPLGKSEEVPYQAPGEAVNTDLFPYQKDSLQALREAAGVQKLADKFGENKWANDKSAQVDSPTDSRLSSLDMPAEPAPPADFFDEGLRPLAETGRPTTTALSPLDQLSRLSGRAKPTARLDELLKKFGGAGS